MYLEIEHPIQVSDTQMFTKRRFQPLSTEWRGYLVTFLVCWALWFIVIFLFCGLDKWSFYAGLALGFFLAIITFAILMYFTGVKGSV